MEWIRSFQFLVNHHALANKWLFLAVICACIPPLSIAADIPAGWRKDYDNSKQAQIYRPIDSSSDILIKYYPKEPLGSADISRWLDAKVSDSKAPKGEWQGEAKVVRDTANYAHALRRFKHPDGRMRELHAVAVTADRDQVRLAVMILGIVNSDIFTIVLSHYIIL
ncbi:MAG: hypothetical protein P8163_09305 [Candidatus Thiodiazotropha sp.]